MGEEEPPPPPSSSSSSSLVHILLAVLVFVAGVAAVAATWVRRSDVAPPPLKEGAALGSETGTGSEKEDVPIFQLSINNSNTGLSGAGTNTGTNTGTSAGNLNAAEESSSSSSSTTTTTTTTAAAETASSDTDPVSKLTPKRASCAGKYVEPNPFGQIETIADRLSYLEDLRFSEGNNTDISTLLLLTLAQQKLNTGASST